MSTADALFSSAFPSGYLKPMVVKALRSTRYFEALGLGYLKPGYIGALSKGVEQLVVGHVALTDLDE
jgi:hypothetical protein